MQLDDQIQMTSGQRLTQPFVVIVGSLSELRTVNERAKSHTREKALLKTRLILSSAEVCLCPFALNGKAYSRSNASRLL